MLDIVDSSISPIEVIDSAGGRRVLDFDRFRYIGVPTPANINKGDCVPVVRDFVGSLYTGVKSLHEAGTPGPTLCNHFNAARRHVIFCDENELSPFTKESVEAQVYDLHEQQRQGKIKDKTETCRRGDISALLQVMNLPHTEWLPKVVLSGTTQQESAKGYSRNELRRLLPLLRAMFKQFAKQYKDDPDAYDGRRTSPLAAQRNRMTFVWQGNEHKVYGAVSKMFSAAVYLMSYYTWANTSVLFSLKRPTQAVFNQSEKWYQMPAFKRRAFKSVTVEMGEGESVDVPKYALHFFDELLTVSRLFWRDESDLLFAGLGKKRSPINSHTIKGLCQYFDEHFPLLDDRGNPMRPRIGRFRATGGEMMLAKHGVTEAALMLDNAPNTVRARYSTGNPVQNTQFLSDASSVLYHAAKNPGSVQSAKQSAAEEKGVSVLSYEAYLEAVSPISKTAHGGYCAQSNEKDEAYTRKAQKKALISEGERLACADLKACFSCEHQVLVESVDDIWSLLSFKECVEESLYQHESTSHFVKNYGDLLAQIESRVSKLSRGVVKRAQTKLADEGRHPLWLDASDLGSVV